MKIMPARSLDATLRRFGAPKRVGVAFSGGGDSMALLHAAVALAEKRGLTICALHVNHRLRPDADADEAFCRRRAGEWGAAFAAAALDPSAFTGNLHDAARRARYAALARLAAAEALDVVLTAHTLDDQAETLLQRILRGSGPAGLAGIRERSGIFARPWLAVRRGALRDYLARHEIDWLEDPSNQNRRFLRARIRGELLPLLESVGGAKAPAALGRLAELAALEREALDEWTAVDLANCRAGAGLSAHRLRELPPARRNLALRRWLRDRGLIPPKKVISSLEGLCFGDGSGGPLRLPGGLAIRRDYDALNWTAVPVVHPAWAAFSAETPVERAFAGGRLRLRVGPAGGEPGVRIAPAELSGCQWRPPWPGARLRPRGMAGRVKCSDLFVNEKIPRALRASWPLLVRNETVLLVPGLRTAAELPLSQEEESWVVRLQWL
jgi:tRNA(Ile)-lysidine synthase